MYVRKSLPKPGSQEFYLILSSKSFIGLGLKVRFVIYFELVFMFVEVWIDFFSLLDV